MFTLFALVFESFGVSLALFFIAPSDLHLDLAEIMAYVTTLNAAILIYPSIATGRKINLEMEDSEMLNKVTNGLVLYSILAIFYFISGLFGILVYPFL